MPVDRCRVERLRARRPPPHPRPRTFASALFLAPLLGACPSPAPAPIAGPEPLPSPFDRARTLDEVLAAAPAGEKGTLTAQGGDSELGMTGGFRLLVPAGALPDGATVNVFRYPVTDSAPGQGSTLYRFEASVQPVRAVKIAFPVPAAPASLDPGRVYVLWHHGMERPMVLRGEVDAGAATVTVSVDRFSTAEVRHEARVEATPAASRVNKVPYYHQGASSACWSASLAMLLNGYGAAVRIWDAFAFFKIPVELGLPWSRMRDPQILEFIRSHLPGVEVERTSWQLGLFDSGDNLRRYLENNLRAGRPTMVGYSCNNQSPTGLKCSSHLVLFVGIEGDRFVVHNPAVGPYARHTWSDIRSRFIWGRSGLYDSTITLALGREIPPVSADASLTVEYPTKGTGFAFLEGDATESAPRKVFDWYVPELGRAGIADARTRKPAAVASGSTLVVNLGVANITDRAPADLFEIGVQIRRNGVTLKTVAQRVNVLLKGGEYRVDVMHPGDLDQLGARQSGRYDFVLFAARAGAILDSVVVPVDVVGEAPPDGAAGSGDCGGETLRDGDACVIKLRFTQADYSPLGAVNPATNRSGVSWQSTDFTGGMVIFRSGGMFTGRCPYVPWSCGGANLRFATLEAAVEGLRDQLERPCVPAANSCPRVAASTSVLVCSSLVLLERSILRNIPPGGTGVANRQLMQVAGACDPGYVLRTVPDAGAGN